MPLPPDVDKRIRARFAKLVQDAEKFRDFDPIMHLSELTQSSDHEFYTLRTNVISLMQLLVSRQNQIGKLIDDVRKLDYYRRDELVGLIDGLKSDYEDGILESLANLIEAEVTSNYLDQAEQLLKAGGSGIYDHVPAAVLTGAILEDALRRLCQRQIPPISVKTGKSYKKMSIIIDDLKKVGVYNELKAKQLRAWTDVRNSAAHGQFGDFTRSDVEQMLAGVQQFLTDYL